MEEEKQTNHIHTGDDLEGASDDPEGWDVFSYTGDELIDFIVQKYGKTREQWLEGKNYSSVCIHDKQLLSNVRNSYLRQKSCADGGAYIYQYRVYSSLTWQLAVLLILLIFPLVLDPVVISVPLGNL